MYDRKKYASEAAIEGGWVFDTDGRPVIGPDGKIKTWSRVYNPDVPTKTTGVIRRFCLWLKRRYSRG